MADEIAQTRRYRAAAALLDDPAALARLARAAATSDRQRRTMRDAAGWRPTIARRAASGPLRRVV